MNLQGIAAELARQWQVIAQAPWLFLGSLVLIGYGIFRVVRYEFTTRLANAASTAAMYKERLERFEIEEKIAIATAVHERSEVAQDPPPRGAQESAGERHSLPANVMDQPLREPAAAAPEAPAGDQPREYVDHDAAYLLSFFDGPNTQLQAQKLVSRELGKWMEVRGVVTAVQLVPAVRPENREICVAVRVGVTRFAFSYFTSNHAALEIIGHGDVVALQGKIETIELMGITLVECELKEHSPMADEQ